MCFEKLFKRKEKLSIPHPEEPPDYSQTTENVDLLAVMQSWFEEWRVPDDHHDFWLNQIAIELRADLPYPASTWEENGVRHLAVRPEWLNPGVIAHEQAHNSYALLSDEQKSEFSAVYTPLKDTAPLIKLLYSVNTYGLTSDIEGHAEVYRYLGEKMPAELKPFYPGLF